LARRLDARLGNGDRLLMVAKEGAVSQSGNGRSTVKRFAESAIPLQVNHDGIARKLHWSWLQQTRLERTPRLAPLGYNGATAASGVRSRDCLFT